KASASELLPERRPLLQESPAADMGLMNRQLDQALASYGWVDRPAGIARIPIKRAIELVKIPSAAPPQEVRR
ncbi:MAG: hypothetical protein ABIT01_02990, partial [Thermoanaerobaculia bacterium]